MLNMPPNPLQLEEGSSLYLTSHTAFRGKQCFWTICPETSSKLPVEALSLFWSVSAHIHMQLPRKIKN